MDDGNYVGQDRKVEQDEANDGLDTHHDHLIESIRDNSPLIPLPPTTSQAEVAIPSDPTLPLTESTSSPMSLCALSDLALHSPSKEIIGTPFALNSPPFEYPFPETSVPSPSSPSHFHISSSLPVTSLVTIDNMSQPTASASPVPRDMQSYSYTHPKMRSAAAREPPIPPGLVKKRHRWSLGLHTIRRSSTAGSVGSAGSDFSYDGSVRSMGSFMSNDSTDTDRGTDWSLREERAHPPTRDIAGETSEKQGSLT